MGASEMSRPANTNAWSGEGGPRVAGWGGAQFLEALFNSVGQQRGGMLLGLLKTVQGRDRGHPVIDELSRRPFNTNPVLAGYVAGALAVRLSREAAECEPEETRRGVERIQGTLAPLIGGIGDRLIWGGVRPVLSLIGILSAFLWVGEPAAWYWLGYNALQLYWRRRSWAAGLRGEEAVRQELAGSTMRRWVSGVGALGRFLLGLTLGVVLTSLWFGQGPAWSGLFLLACLLGFVLARWGRVSPLALGWIGIVVAGLMALVRLGLGRDAR